MIHGLFGATCLWTVYLNGLFSAIRIWTVNFIGLFSAMRLWTVYFKWIMVVLYSYGLSIYLWIIRNYHFIGEISIIMDTIMCKYLLR